jgi:broad specificity phosphatase PhoE
MQQSGDSRTTRALATAKKFLQEYNKGLDTYAPEEITDTANQLQKAVAFALGCQESIREIDVSKVTTLKDLLQTYTASAIFMRHGEQELNDETQKLSGTLRKIKQMQLPYNMTDGITDSSLVEAIGTGFVLQWILHTTKKTLQIISSENERAHQVATVIAAVTNTPVHLDHRLNSISLPSNVGTEKLLALLGEDSKEQLVWKQEIIDTICGTGTFERITQTVHGCIAESLQLQNTITLYITHTQQTNAADVEAGETPIRLPNLGFRVFSKSQNEKNSAKLFVNGFYQ